MKESSDGETLIAVGIRFQICGAAEEKARRPKSVFNPGNMQERLARGTKKTTGLVVRYKVIEIC